MSANKDDTNLKFTISIEKLLIRAAFIGMLLLIVFQFVMQNDTARVFLNYATALEGGPLEEAQTLSKEGDIYILLENEHPVPGAKLLLNGEPFAAFDNAEIKVNVRNNDVLELDASKCGDEFIHICVVGKSDNVRQPDVGRRVKAKERIELISRVKLK